MTLFEEAAAGAADGADHHVQAQALVAQMTLDEKLGMLDGDLPFWPGFARLTDGSYYKRTWPAAAVDRLGIPGIEFSDGPRGCVSARATAFPVSMARGATFDPDLEERVGEAIGAEIRAAGGTYTGAVCMNLLRHPAWGRAQETYGEDPHHVGEMAAALTRGLQRHVMACMKHFACNSIENSRFRVDVTVDERALHEVYLPHFRRVADEGVASVMSAYNSLNGAWCSENAVLLTDILRDEWGWDGFVTSDFVFGVRDPVASLVAGLNIEMPFQQLRHDALPAALDSGALDPAVVDERVREIVATLLRFADRIAARPAPDVIASPRHRDLAREVAVAATVLVSNDGLLPVDRDALHRVVVLGRLARLPNLGDRGSSNVHAPDVVTPLDGLRAALTGVDVVHDDDDAALAADADLAVVVVGYTHADEGEYVDPEGTLPLLHLFPPIDHPTLGVDAADIPSSVTDDDPPLHPEGEDDGLMMAPGGDRATLRLRPEDEALIAAACQVSDRVVVVVMAGSAVVMPWLDRAPATLFVWYPGIEGGNALADVILGSAEPGGRLPFAIPADERDLVPFDNTADRVTYDLLHGQWWLDEEGAVTHRPFGFGLGYTTFEMGDAAVDSDLAGHPPRLLVDVENVGDREGSTVVQVYAGVPGSRHRRPPRRLVGFRRVRLAAGASATVAIPLDMDLLRVRIDGRWVTEDLPIELAVGWDAHDIRRTLHLPVPDPSPSRRS